MKNSINKIKNFLSVIVYTYNDETYIQTFLTSVDTILKDNFQNYEFIIINNFSTDNTLKAIKEVKEKINSKITIINLSHKHSLDACMLAGSDISIGDFILEFENCFVDYDINEVINIYNMAMKGNDVVIFTPHGKMNSAEKVFYKLLKHPFRKDIPLRNDRFRIFSRRALNRIYNSDSIDVYRKFRYYYSGLSTDINYYNAIGKGKYTNNKNNFFDCINMLLQYTNCYLVILYIYLLFIFISIFILSIPVSILISLNFLFLILTLNIVIKYIKSLANSSKNKYIYSSIERL